MSRSSAKRRKERLKQQSDDPKWIGIRNLLALYGLRIYFDREMLRKPATRETAAVFTEGYRIHRGKVGHILHVGNIFADAPLEAWIEACAKIDREGTSLDPYAHMMQYMGAYKGTAGASLWASYKKCQWVNLQKRWQGVRPKTIGIDFETIEEHARMARAMFVTDESIAIYQAPAAVEPAPVPARRGWRGYTASAGARGSQRVAAQDRPPRTIPRK